MALQTLFTRTRVPGTELVRTHCVVCGLMVGCSTQKELLGMVEAVHTEHRHTPGRVYVHTMGATGNSTKAQRVPVRK